MKGNKIAELIELADAIIIDNDLLTYASFESDGELCSLDIEYERELQIFNYSFKWWMDDEIRVENNQIYLYETNLNDFLSVILLEIKKL